MWKSLLYFEPRGCSRGFGRGRPSGRCSRRAAGRTKQELEHNAARLAAERRSSVMLTRNLAPAYHDLIVSWFRDQGFSVNTAYESDNLFNSLTLVACGIGVAFLPSALKGLTRDVIFI